MGDAELDRIHDLSREILKNLFEKEQALQKAKSPDFSDSRLKKIRKVMTQLDQNHKMYANALDNILSKGGSEQVMGDAIRSHIRGVEESALEAFKLLDDDSVHHIIQSRTGGDTLIQAPGDRVRRVMRRLEEKYDMTFSNTTGPKGNLRARFSLSNRAHKKDARERGLEAASGIGQEPTKDTTAHRKSTAGYSRNLTAAELADDDSLFNALDKMIAGQIEDAEIGAATDAKRQSLIRAATGDELAYADAATAEDVAATKQKVGQLSSDEIIETYRQGYDLDFTGATVKLKRRQMAALAGAGLAGFSVIGTAASAAETVGRTQIASKTGNPLDWLQTGLAGASLISDFVPVAGELISTPADALNVVIDTVRDPGSLVLSRQNRLQQERKEKLQMKPADAPERSNALSVGFTDGGM